MPRGESSTEGHVVATDRPYRSHSQPACLPCRRRKSRCKFDSQSTCCMMCRVHATDCIVPAAQNTPTGRRPTTASRARARKQPSGDTSRTRPPDELAARQQEPQTAPDAAGDGHGQRAHPEDGALPVGSEWLSSAGETNVARYAQIPDLLTEWGSGQESSHIIGPAAANDAHVLEDYISGNPQLGDISRIIRPVPISNQAGASPRPVFFKSVQKRPIGTSANQAPGFTQCQIVEKLIEAHAPKLINL